VEVIPAIDLLGRQAVRLEQGDYARVAEYGTPTELAARFAAAGAGWIHVVDLDGARGGLIRPVVVAALVHASSPASVQASGGVRSVADAEALLRAGASRVVVGTVAWSLLDELVASLGEKLVVALDVREGIVRTRGWTESGLALDEALVRCAASRVPRLLCTAIERDGTLTGPDVELVRHVVDRSDAPVLAAGGISSEADLDALQRAGAEGAIVGRALYESRFTIPDARAAIAAAGAPGSTI
jgi:phosphoribosylformimino-5-aminoimidazole carboxamide ribotide isomerase